MTEPRDPVVKQHTQLGNVIRGHLAEYGWVAPKGTAHRSMLADLLEGGEIGETLPEAARPMFMMMVDMLADLDQRVAALDNEIARRAREDVVARRLMTIPGVGPITATAIAAIAPPAGTFAKGRDFVAWLGLVPNQASPAYQEHGRVMWFRSVELPYGPAAYRCITGRTDGSIRLRVRTPRKPLATEGASADGDRSAAD